MTVKYRPDHCRTVTPYLVVEDADAFIDFVQQAFDAKIIEQVRAGDKNKTAHCEVMTGDSFVMAGSKPEADSNGDSMLYLYVKDTDKVYQKAQSAGATSLQEPVNQFYGDRNATVEDSQGMKWSIATRVENVSDEEMKKRVSELHSKA